MNILLPFLPLTALFLSGGHPPAEKPAPTGVYGVCGCAEEAPGPIGIALTVNEDGTFHYVNATDPARSIDAQGHWQWEGRKLVLITDGGNEQTCTLDKDDPCLRMRTGLTFTRLCRLEKCP